MTEPVPTQNGDQNYQPDRVNSGALTKALLFLAILIGLAMWVCLWVVGQFAGENQEEPHPMAGYRDTPDAAVLQASPNEGVLRFQERQERLFHAYDWIDPKTGVVRIPVERAKDLLLNEEAFSAKEGNE